MSVVELVGFRQKFMNKVTHFVVYAFANGRVKIILLGSQSSDCMSFESFLDSNSSPLGPSSTECLISFQVNRDMMKYFMA